MKFLTLVLLAALILPEAATVKRPLTPVTKHGMYHFTWTGSAPVVTADDLVFSADTSTSYGMDPAYTVYKRAIGLNSVDKVFPGEKAPEKFCVAVTAAGDGDATTSDVFFSTATTASGTHRKVGGTAQTFNSTVSSTVTEVVAAPINPFQYWKLTIDPTTTTDSIEVVGVDIWPCDD